MLSTIYRYITDPHSTIARDFAPVDSAALVVFSAAVSTATQGHLGFGTIGAAPVWGVLFYFVAAVLVWAIQTAFIEFIAQLFGHTTPRLVLFSWLGMAQLPLAATLPLLTISLTVHRVAPLIGMLVGVCQLAWFVLQIMTLKKLYSVTWVRATLLYLAPLLAVVAAILFLVISVGMMSW